MLNAKNFGLACGITWAFGAFVTALIASSNGYGSEFVSLLGTVYIGYEATLKGAIIGAIWGFIDAGIGGYVLAWIYNKLQG